ncbi:MAG: SRPBCC family protein [Verrucomicrobia bacterium]|nr:SRPBCC family protein [Verrucomicrobiota bacterium]
MIRLEHSIEVNAAAERVFEWLVRHLTDKEAYCAWHPDHVDLRWIKGEPGREGSIVYAEEVIHGAMQKLRFRITKVVPNHEIVYRPLFPVSLIVPANTFLIEPTGDGRCTYTVNGSIRLPHWLFRRGRIESTLCHIRKEGEALKAALENTMS